MTLGSRLPRESFLGSVWLYHMHSLKSKLRSSFWIIVALFNRNTFSMWNLREWEVKLQGDLKTNERAASAFFFWLRKAGPRLPECTSIHHWREILLSNAGKRVRSSKLEEICTFYFCSFLQRPACRLIESLCDFLTVRVKQMSVSTKREGNLSGTVFMTSFFNLHDQWRVLRNVIFLSLAKQCLNWCHFATSSDLSDLDHFS